jgi:hypothetical protein
VREDARLAVGRVGPPLGLLEDGLELLQLHARGLQVALVALDLLLDLPLIRQEALQRLLRLLALGDDLRARASE